MKTVSQLALVLLGILVFLSQPLPTGAAILSLKATPQAPSVSLDAASSARSRPDQGDVITVRSDDWNVTDPRFGSEECWRKPPIVGGRLACLDIVDLRQEDLLYLTSTLPDMRFRRYRFEWRLLPAQLRSDLETYGYAFSSWSEVRPSLRDMMIEVVP